MYLQELEQVSYNSSEERENLETIKDILTPHNPENNFHLSVFKEFRKNLVSSDDQHLALLLDTLTDPNLNTNYPSVDEYTDKHGQDLTGGARAVAAGVAAGAAAILYLKGNQNEWIDLPNGNLKTF